MKLKNLASIIFSLLIFSFSVSAQKPTPTPPANDDDVVKISTNLVQVDAIVTDKNGNPITDLTANDFEIWQDGKRQTITNLSYVNRTASEETSTQPIVEKKKDKKDPLPPPASPRSTEFGRVLTFIVDDGNGVATLLGLVAAKEGLEKFVREQMLPNDLVAIYQTRGGNSLFQQYTSDKSRLLQIIRRIRWYPPNGAFSNNTGGNDDKALDDGTRVNGGSYESERDKAVRERMMDFSREKQTAGLLGVLQYAIKGLYPIKGRKVLFLMSDSLPVGSLETETAIKEIAALANRASVVVNSMDVRGMDLLMSKAEKGGPSESLATYTTNDAKRQSGLSLISAETGGSFYQNMNFLDVPIQKVLKREKGYYLIGYQPDEEVFKGINFHKISLKLNRNDLNVSSRSGFYGVTDEEIRPKPRTGDGELYDALITPLPNADMNIRLSAYFANTPSKGNFIHALLYIDGKDITFTDGSNGNKKAVFDIVAVTLGEKNKVIDDSNSTRAVQIPLANVEAVKQSGLIYTVDVPVKNDGIYTFRTAVREVSANRLGSSSQVIEVPNLKKSKIFLSGLIISGVDTNGKMYEFEGERTANSFSPVVSSAIPAIRQFRRNTVLSYAYTIYNAKIDSATSKPKLTIQTKLFSDGKVFSEGTPQPADIGIQTDLTRIRDFAYMRLNADVPIGDYALQVIVKDLQTNQITSQWIDFEVIE